MISLAFHHDRVLAATISDGGDYILTSDVATHDGDYRGWLLAARDAVDALGDGTSAMKVAVALPAIVAEDVVGFTPLATIGQSNFGDCLAAFEARDMPKSDTLVALWIGKSCHGGIWANGARLEGAHGAAGNWAHLQLPSPVPHELDGRHCWCGRTGCLETFLSDSGFEDDYERITGERQDAVNIAAAAATGDIVADSVVQVFEDRLGRATATIISLFDPQMIILGGMVPLAERLETRVPRKWPGYVQINRTKTRLAISTNGAEALLKGAALLMSGKDRR